MMCAPATTEEAKPAGKVWAGRRIEGISRYCEETGAWIGIERDGRLYIPKSKHGREYWATMPLKPVAG